MTGKMLCNGTYYPIPMQSKQICQACSRTLCGSLRAIPIKNRMTKNASGTNLATIGFFFMFIKD
jgi:hypothetical protein